MNVFEIIIGVVCIVLSFTVIAETLMTKQDSRGLSAALDNRPAGNMKYNIDFKAKALNKITSITIGILIAFVFVLNIVATHLM